RGPSDRGALPDRIVIPDGSCRSVVHDKQWRGSAAPDDDDSQKQIPSPGGRGDPPLQCLPSEAQRPSLNSPQRRSTSSVFSYHHLPSIRTCCVRFTSVVGNSCRRSCGSSASSFSLGPV